MSLNGMMRTGVSGMNAQANRLSTVAENIANSDTTGYKKAATEFSSLILPNSGGNYNSGGVTTDVRYAVDKQGELEFTSSKTDLAINGQGFFIVQDEAGTPFLTRAGSFVPNGQGELVNAAGFTLLGYPYDAGSAAVVVNGFDGLRPINIAQSALSASASTTGQFSANLPAGAAVGDIEKPSLVTYDNLGNKVLVDLNFEKTVDYDAASGSGPETWVLDITRQSDGVSVGTVTLTFDPATGDLTSGDTVSFAVPGGQTVTLDLSGMQALGYPYDQGTAKVDGNEPAKLTSVQIDTDGTVYGQYENGNLEPLYRIAMANVQSPGKLVPQAGNVYTQGVDSGVVVTGFPETGSFGEIVSSALEGSNVDIAEELTSMIESQRSYTANSKVFQTGSDLMDVLVNLKR